MQKLTIRPAAPSDTATIMEFVIALATYEKEPESVESTEQQFKDALFGDHPNSFCLIAELNNKPVGFALYFYNFSTWKGKNGIYLEDLFVVPEARGYGAGKALLQELAKIAVANDCGRVEWSVLDWNEPAIQFYQAFGATPQDTWTVYRLENKALRDFAKA